MPRLVTRNEGNPVGAGYSFTKGSETLVLDNWSPSTKQCWFRFDSSGLVLIPAATAGLMWLEDGEKWKKPRSTTRHPRPRSRGRGGYTECSIRWA